MAFKLMDSKVGERARFERLEEARASLGEWIRKQRTANEPVVEQPTGQWSDSRTTIWITDEHDQVLRLA
jgi:hypothetical protein